MMNWKERRVLVTGGASFIGSHLVERLVQLGATVRVADDLSSGRQEHLSAVINDIDFRQGDLRHMDFASESSKGCDALFHLAADHGGRGYIATHPANCAVNMALDNIVFHTAVRNGLEQIIFTSSACVYPTNIQLEKQLLREDMVHFDKPGGAFADEEYGWAKLMGELSLRAHCQQHGIAGVSTRLSTAYGPRENESHAIIALIAKAFTRQSPFEIWGSGEQTRGFTYVDDIVSGILLAAEHIHDGSAVNVGTDEFVSLNRLAKEIFESMDWQPPEGIHHLIEKPVGVMHRALDLTHAKATTGWCPEVSVAEGVRRTVHWYVATHDREEVAAKLEALLMAR